MLLIITSLMDSIFPWNNFWAMWKISVNIWLMSYYKDFIFFRSLILWHEHGDCTRFKVLSVKLFQVGYCIFREDS
jgi:hypothetical protein